MKQSDRYAPIKIKNINGVNKRIDLTEDNGKYGYRVSSKMDAKKRLLKHIKSQGKSNIVIIGLSKNAGKTTLLNWLLENCGLNRVGVITTGRDGEDYDKITVKQDLDWHFSCLQTGRKDNRLAKPKISLPPGAVFTARKDTVRKFSSSLTVIEKLSYKAGGSNLWIVQTQLPILTEIVGPPTVQEQLAVIEKLHNYGSELVFVDGSVDRKAISSAEKIGTLIVVVSPQAGNLIQIKNKLKHLIRLTEVVSIDDDPELMLLPQKELGSVYSQINNYHNITIFYSRQQSGLKVEPLTFNTLLGNEKKLLAEFNDKKIKYVYIPTSLTDRSLAMVKRTIIKNKIRIMINHPFQLLISEHSLTAILPNLRTVRKMKIDAVAVSSFAPNGNYLDCDLLRSAIRNEIAMPVVDVREMSKDA